MNSASVEECVRRHHCDVGVLGRRARSPALRQIPIAQDEIVLALPRTHRLAALSEVDVDALAGETFVVREPGSGTSEAVLAALAAQGRSLPSKRVAAEVTGAQAHIAAIASGQGIGFVSLPVAERTGHGALSLVRLRGVGILRVMHLLFDPRRLTNVAQAFVDFIRQRAPA
jgi:DNA-binding transcriptional LysR family regulator